MNSDMLARLNELFSDASDGVCVADACGRILYANPAAERLLHLPHSGALAHMCSFLCDRLVQPGAELPSKTCPLLDPASPETRALFSGPFGGAPRYKWSVDGRLVAGEAPHLLADCLKLGRCGSDWDGLHIMRVERLPPKDGRDE